MTQIRNWHKAILYIERQEKSVGFKSSYINEKDEEVRIDTEVDYFTSKAVQNLHKNTTNHTLIHIKWNKAKFIITPDSEFEIEYIWDQEWQDEIDRSNSAG